MDTLDLGSPCRCVDLVMKLGGILWVRNDLCYSTKQPKLPLGIHDLLLLSSTTLLHRMSKHPEELSQIAHIMLLKGFAKLLCLLTLRSAVLVRSRQNPNLSPQIVKICKLSHFS